MVDARSLYIDLLKRCLLNTIYSRYEPEFDSERRKNGLDWPMFAQTMVGEIRLDHLQWCVETAITESVQGDLIETGVWRGGSCILMKGVLAAYGVTDKTVWVADSFRGFPPADISKFPCDAIFTPGAFQRLAVSKEEVEKNFSLYGLLDEKVKFLEGWFKDTLLSPSISSLSVLRLDGDMYESTIQSLNALYPKLSPNGFCIVDDFGAVEPCRAAVTDYLKSGKENVRVEKIDHTGVFWRKPSSETVTQ